MTSVHALICDVFPAEVAFPDGRVERRARAFITDKGIIVVAQRGPEARVIFREPHAAEPILPARNAPRTATTSVHVVGGTITVRRVGCACGSALRAVTLDAVIRGEVKAE